MNDRLQIQKQLAFSDSTNLYGCSQGLVWTIERPFESLEEFWDTISTSLEFPEYFGRNWDACFDCLSTATYYLKIDVWLIHETLPFQSARDNFTWLRCVADSMESVKADEYTLNAVFRNNLKYEIDTILSNRN